MAPDASPRSRRLAPRRSPALLLAGGLALATALTLLRAAAMVGDDRPRDLGAAANRTVIERFYLAVNDAIRTGDATPVDALVAPNAVVEGVLPAPTDRAGIERRLVALHATLPGLQLRVEELLADGDRVAARVSWRATEPGAFLGMPLPLADAPTPWGSLDLFRVAGGRVVAHRSLGATPALLQPLLRTSLAGGPAPPAVVGLVRLTLDPSAAAPSLVNFGPAVLLVEAGALTVNSATATEVVRAAGGAPHPPEATVPRADVVLGPGDAISLPIGTAYAIRNDGPAAAVTLGVAVLPVGSASAPAERIPTVPLATALFLGQGSLAGPATSLSAPWPRGVRAEPLAGGVTTEATERPLTVSVGRATLASGARLPLAMGTGIGLLTVEAGSADLALTGGHARLRDARDSAPPSRGLDGPGAATLGAAAAAILDPGTDGALRVPGDASLTLLMVTVIPAADGQPGG